MRPAFPERIGRVRSQNFRQRGQSGQTIFSPDVIPSAHELAAPVASLLTRH